MKPEITADGVQIQTYDEIYNELADGYRAIYGPDINLDPDSPDGQRVGIEATARLDLQQSAALLYNQLDPDFSFGEFQNKLLKLAGLTRRPASRSQVDVDIVTDRALTLDADYTVTDELGQNWETQSPVVIGGAGTTSVTLFSENFGAVEALADTVTAPSTIVIGVTSVTNPLAAIVGVEEETAPQARIRRAKSVANPSTSSLGGLFSALVNIAGVTDVKPYENDTPVYDATLDLDAHTIWCVVEGGEIVDIIEALVRNKTGGAGTKGAVVGDYVEALPTAFDPDFTITHTLRFDRPTYAPLSVRMDVIRKNPASPVDDAAIAAALAGESFLIAQNAIASALYSPVYSAGDNFVALNLEINNGSGWTDGRILSAADGKFTIDAGDVTVTDVTP